MSGPDLDLEKANAIGGLDRLLTNSGLAVIAVIPTLGTAFLMPWRLASLITHDEPDGRKGFLLSPGAFLPLALFLAFLIGAGLSSPELASTNGAFLGPQLAFKVSSAAGEGDIWGIVGAVLPIYVFSLGLGVVGRCLTFMIGEAWTMRVSIRAAFYFVATATTWIILSTAMIDILRSNSNGPIDYVTLSSLSALIMAFIWIWTYFWFVRTIGKASILVAVAVPIVMIGSILGTIATVGIVFG